MTGNELRRERQSLKLTQVALAKKLGISGNTVARWERDEISIPPYLDLALKHLEAKETPKNDMVK